jgi:hypothetical protein
MATTKCLWEKKRPLWRSRIVAGACMALLMVATASGQLKRIPGTAQSNMVPCPAAGYTCYPQSIARGPNANGSTLGTAWVLGTAKTSAGDYYVYQRRVMLCYFVPGHHVFCSLRAFQKPVSFRFIPKTLVC